MTWCTYLLAQANVPTTSALDAFWQWSNQPVGHATLAVVTIATGLWLMFLRRGLPPSVLGAALATLGLMMFMSRLPAFGQSSETIAFWVLAGLTIISAGATITSASPVYCAVWFALSLLGTGGLFLLQGAQFLGVATVAVYAGAIVVTFLFVLMLSQPEGNTYYDRLSWGKLPVALAVLAGATVIGGVTLALGDIGGMEIPGASDAAGVLHHQHVAQLGGQLFTRHLVAVQLAGTLLLVALVGAVAILIQSRGPERHHE